MVDETIEVNTENRLNLNNMRNIRYRDRASRLEFSTFMQDLIKTQLPYSKTKNVLLTREEIEKSYYILEKIPEVVLPSHGFEFSRGREKMRSEIRERARGEGENEDPSSPCTYQCESKNTTCYLHYSRHDNVKPHMIDKHEEDPTPKKKTRPSVADVPRQRAARAANVLSDETVDKNPKSASEIRCRGPLKSLKTVASLKGAKQEGDEVHYLFKWVRNDERDWVPAANVDKEFNKATAAFNTSCVQTSAVQTLLELTL
ncbi:hypothetical protein DAPPUDRAFT_264108 [Daphnia pulex]|uniref:Chromo domain-containing protein n=1 Tax=Daphnia pulex TaxID=6669 RepID=E9HQW7_DAPPU|nr:hypothetical protein DAPPUDRAFT_264108 [Daphnia pulex]|eukprot:EFX65866.1 hypothetical protein DAPPUDRAFT_264108 [Daphnia pulex]